jgi:hypothetical protein
VSGRIDILSSQWESSSWVCRETRSGDRATAGSSTDRHRAPPRGGITNVPALYMMSQCGYIDTTLILSPKNPYRNVGRLGAHVPGEPIMSARCVVAAPSTGPASPPPAPPPGCWYWTGRVDTFGEHRHAPGDRPPTCRAARRPRGDKEGPAPFSGAWCNDVPKLTLGRVTRGAVPRPAGQLGVVLV